MTPQNEPMTGFAKNYSFNTMGFTDEMERDFIKTDLGPTLEKAGWTPGVRFTKALRSRIDFRIGSYPKSCYSKRFKTIPSIR